MTDPYTVYAHHIPELPPETPEAGRLGRHIWHDSRRVAYPAFPEGAARRVITSTTHQRHIPPLNQGEHGSCTGNAIIGAAATSPLFEALPAERPALTESLAYQVYCDAELLDGGPGCAKGQDDGSTGQSVCKIAVKDGFISGYTWATNLADTLAGLMTLPAILGINWYSSFDSPDPTTGVLSLPTGAYIRGGHEIEATEIDTERKLVGCWNSWGPTWGLGGKFYLPYTILERLLAEDGDCIFPQPATTPPPQPTPPGPHPVLVDEYDRALGSPHTIAWAEHRHFPGGDTAKVAHDLRTWLTAKGLTH